MKKSEMTTTERIGEDGFTMLEMLIAMTILAIGLLGVAALQITAIQGSAYSIKASQATAHISDKFEEFKTKPLESIESGTEQRGIYTIKTTVKSGPVAGTSNILIEASWKDNIEHKIAYQSILAEQQKGS
jgi:prepilin-type N-terminal cleavage/methylation domain-containing protein